MLKSKNSLRDNLYPYLLFLITPILTLFMAFREHETKWARNILWFFVAYFAATISRVDESWDISRYIDQFVETHRINQSFGGFIKEVSEGSPDFIQPFINFLVSKISGNFRVLLVALELSDNVNKKAIQNTNIAYFKNTYELNSIISKVLNNSQ